MKGWIACFLCLFLVVAPVYTSLAQDPAAEKTEKKSEETIKFTNKQKAVLHYLNLQLSMLAGKSGLPARDQQLINDKLIVTYEKMVELYCMPSLRETLKYEGNPSHPKCLEFLGKLSDLHPVNPVAVCARLGIDSEECQNAYDNQYISIYRNVDGNIEEVDLETKLHSLRNKKERRSLEENLRNASKEYFHLKNSANSKNKQLLFTKWREIARLYSKLFPITCNLIRVRIEHQPVDQALRASSKTKKTSKKDDPLRTLVSQFESVDLRNSQKRTTRSRRETDDFAAFEVAKEKKVVVNEEPLWRVRYISSECQRLIHGAFEFDSRLSSAICHREGFSSPNCIKARRHMRERYRRTFINSTDDKKKKSKSVFVEF